LARFRVWRNIGRISRTVGRSLFCALTCLIHQRAERREVIRKCRDE
jgi:hypothetical protein